MDRERTDPAIVVRALTPDDLPSLVRKGFASVPRLVLEADLSAWPEPQDPGEPESGAQ